MCTSQSKVGFVCRRVLLVAGMMCGLPLMGGIANASESIELQQAADAVFAQVDSCKPGGYFSSKESGDEKPKSLMYR